MEIFNRGWHVVADFLDVEKEFDNVWNNGLRCKIFQLDIPTKMTRWLSNFLVVRVIKVDVNGFLSNQINPKAGVPHGSVLSSLLFLIYVNDLPTPHHKQNSPSQFADDTAQWVYSLNVRFAAKFLQQDLLNLAVRCAKWRMKLNPEKNQVDHILQAVLTRKTEPNLKLYGETLKVYPQVKCLGITFDSQLNLKKKHFEDILDGCNTRYHRLRLPANKKSGPLTQDKNLGKNDNNLIFIPLSHKSMLEPSRKWPSQTRFSSQCHNIESGGKGAANNSGLYSSLIFCKFPRYLSRVVWKIDIFQIRFAA